MSSTTSATTSARATDRYVCTGNSAHAHTVRAHVPTCLFSCSLSLSTIHFSFAFPSFLFLCLFPLSFLFVFCSLVVLSVLSFRYWCHTCQAEISPNFTPDLVCSRCNGDFVELIEEEEGQVVSRERRGRKKKERRRGNESRGDRTNGAEETGQERGRKRDGKVKKIENRACWCLRREHIQFLFCLFVCFFIHFFFC